MRIHRWVLAVTRILICLFVCGVPGAIFAQSAPRTVLVVAPHPDDETLLGAGIILSAIASADTVKVVIVTNGDIDGVQVIPPIAAASLSLNPTSVTGGNSSQGTVTLSGSAPAGGAVVTLSSSNTAVATVPASVTVPAGSTSASSTVATSAVSKTTPVKISASYGGTVLVDNLPVKK